MTIAELYYSDTCQNCHQLRTLLMEILPKSTKFKEINVSYPEGKQRASQLNIMSVPTVVIDGDIMFVGRVSKDELMKEISKAGTML
jgi:alkyl hydroperoxide reductase subunit AhpF